MISGPTAGEAARDNAVGSQSIIRTQQPDGQQSHDRVTSNEHIRTIADAPHSGR